MSSIQKQFEAAMLDIYRRAKDEARYTATFFLQMLHERGGLATAKHLINSDRLSDGYEHMFRLGRLDLTVEAMVTSDERWAPLFTPEELEKARKRLADCHYDLRARYPQA